MTKRYVVRVCKQWNAWASPYLYESLYLGRSKSLPSLRDALVRARDSEDVNMVSHTSGRWTKRLDIALRDNLSKQDIESRDEIVVSLISEIVQCLPTLIIVNFGCHQSSSWPIIWNLANTCGSTLQAVVCRGDILAPAPDVWRKLLEKAAHLRFLLWPKHLRLYESEVLPPVLPSLELLQVDDYPLFGHFPSLRHLVFDVRQFPIPTGWKPFLEVNGMKLEVVQLNISTCRSTITIMTFLFDCCPNLVRLNITATDWDLIMFTMNKFGHKLPTKLRTLGLQSTTIQSSSQMHSLLFYELQNMKFPSSLSCIQLFDGGNVKDLTQKHPRILTEGLVMLRKKGLELRDHEGCLMG